MKALTNRLKFSLGTYDELFRRACSEIEAHNFQERIKVRDHTLWKPDPDEIANRLDWLDLPVSMESEIEELTSFAGELKDAGFRKALLLGMGGSSLAPRVFAELFGSASGYLELGVLDSTYPGEVMAYRDQFDPNETLYVVSSKSGGTVETLSFLKYFYNDARESLGGERVGAHFVAITDPGSDLESTANERQFRCIFLNNPNMGGRYSALSHFGLVPAALLGVDLRALLRSARQMREQCMNAHIGLELGAVLGALAKQGRDKLTFLFSSGYEIFGAWLEQLIAESTGKEGVGILPVVGERLGELEDYGDDRLFVQFSADGDASQNMRLQKLQSLGHPVIEVDDASPEDVGGQFYLWEFATAVACHVLGVNPFDQPDVEAAKRGARAVLERLDSANKTEIISHPPSDVEKLRKFLDHANPGDYVAFQTYLLSDRQTDELLSDLRSKIRDHTQAATTLGYGPRYLHSTGQLHKGDGGNGLFVQITCEHEHDLAIPDRLGVAGSSMSFGTLINAQADGDYVALRNAGRRVIRFDLGLNVVEGLKALRDSLN